MPKDPFAPQPATSNRIRGPKLKVFITNADGVPMEEAIRRADEAGLVIASNKRMDQALVGSEEWKSVQTGSPCWTGTMTAYEEPGKAFGKIIEYTDDKTGLRYVFPVPDKFVGIKDSLLVVEHPGFMLEFDGDSRIVRASEVDLIDMFPTNKTGWYIAEPIHEIPRGEKVDNSSPDARCLWRIAKRVGLLARNYGAGDGRLVVYAVGKPSDTFELIVESPETDVPE